MQAKFSIFITYSIIVRCRKLKKKKKNINILRELHQMFNYLCSIVYVLEVCDSKELFKEGS